MEKGYLFDLDGTLLDSMHIWDDVGLRFLQRHAIPVPRNLQETIKDMSFAQSAQYFITHGNLAMCVEEVCDEIYAMVTSQYATQVTCKEGVTCFLKQSKQRNIPMGIVTALDRNVALACLKHNAIDTYFSFILTCDEFKSGKDTNAIYLEGAKRLACDPTNVVVFEDALYAMKSAKSASMHVIGIYDDTQSISEQDKKQYCDTFIYSFKQLCKEAVHENSINNSGQ